MFMSAAVQQIACPEQKITAGLSLHKMQTKKQTPKHDDSGTSASYNTQ